MTPINKILVPVDLSPQSLGAARYAASLASAFGSELVFVHALDDGWPLGVIERGVRDRIMKVPGGASRILLCQGPPVPVILEMAEAERVDLVLMPTRGKSALSRFLDGSITAQVLREARCPVWTGLGDPPLSNRPIRTILCGLSLGPRASSILRWSAGLATRLKASLCVIHASKGLEFSPGLPCDQEWRLLLKKMARDEIWALQAGAGTDAEVWLEPGRPLETILPLADRLRADLLVVGKSPERRFLGDLRTLSYEMACRARCPVASV